MKIGKGFKYPCNYHLEALLEKHPDLADISITAYLRDVVIQSA